MNNSYDEKGVRERSFSPLIADLHIHTIASGHAYSTVDEICRAAAAKGIKLVALTDHGPAMPGGTHKYHFGNMRVLPSHIHGVRLLSGVEANIVSIKGELDLSPFYLSLLDIVWAGLHNPCYAPGSSYENTQALINTLRNPYVDGIVHPGNPDYPMDIEAVVKEAQRQGKLIEINNSSLFIRTGSRKNCEKIAVAAAKEGCFVAVNSDAHYAEDAGKTEAAYELAVAAGLKNDQIINTSLERIHDFIKRRKSVKAQ